MPGNAAPDCSSALQPPTAARRCSWGGEPGCSAELQRAAFAERFCSLALFPHVVAACHGLEFELASVAMRRRRRSSTGSTSSGNDNGASATAGEQKVLNLRLNAIEKALCRLACEGLVEMGDSEREAISNVPSLLKTSPPGIVDRHTFLYGFDMAVRVIRLTPFSCRTPF